MESAYYSASDYFLKILFFESKTFYLIFDSVDFQDQQHPYDL